MRGPVEEGRRRRERHPSAFLHGRPARPPHPHAGRRTLRLGKVSILVRGARAHTARAPAWPTAGGGVPNGGALPAARNGGGRRRARRSLGGERR